MKKRKRKSIRLKEYDYSADGYYFVTISTANGVTYFGNVKNGEMVLNEYGNIVNTQWVQLPQHYWNTKLDEYVIMPDHIHGIIIIDNNRAGYKPAPTHQHNVKKPYSLHEIIRGFKTFTSKNINTLNTTILFRWQRSFYDRIIRNENELHKIRTYILKNPLNWEIERNTLINLDL